MNIANSKLKNTKIYEKITNIALDILIVIFGIILLITIYNSIQIKVMGNHYSSFFGYSTFEVETGSMEDAINIGDWIIVKSGSKFKLNDVVTFEQNGEFITHRIVEVHNNTYVTRGDANNSKDDPINKKQVIGRVVKILPHFGIFRKTLFNPVVLMALIVTIYLISSLFKKDKKNKLTIFMNNIMKKIKSKTEKKKIEEKVEPIKKEVVFEQVVTHEENYDLDQVKTDAENLENLDKTMCFRVIPVDRSEIDNTFLDAANNQISETNFKEVSKKIVEEQEEVDLDDDSLMKSNLEMLQKKKNKKFSNVLDKIIFIKKEEIFEIIDILNLDEKLQVNEATIMNSFMESYIDVKYYNYCGNVNVEYTDSNMVSKIKKAIKEISQNIIKEYNGSDKKYADKVKKYENIFTLIVYLEQAKDLISDMNAKKVFYNEKIIKFTKVGTMDSKTINNVSSRIIKSQKIFEGMVEYLLKKQETNTFDLKINQLNSKKSLYGLVLEHNINFSKVYSDYIIDKTYTEGIIAEDKVIVLMSLLMVQLAKDIIIADFDKKYILYVPETLYTKENKLNKLFKMMENEYAKNNIIILIKYSELLKNKKIIRKLIKSGYRFALVFEDSDEIKAKDYGETYIVEYIFINKKSVNSSKIISTMPEDLLSKILYEDILDKVGSFGGE